MQKPPPHSGPPRQLLHSPLGLLKFAGSPQPPCPQPRPSVGSPYERVPTCVSSCPKPRHLLSQEAQTYWEVEASLPT